MADIFLLSLGDYSDYHVVAVLTDEARARDLSENYGYRLEKFPLDPPSPFPAGHVPYEVLIDRDGKIWHAEQDNMPTWGPQSSVSARPAQTKRDRTYPRGDPRRQTVVVPDCLLVNCWATHIAHAQKIAAERRKILLAHELWPDHVSSKAPYESGQHRYHDFGWSAARWQQVAALFPEERYEWPEMEHIEVEPAG